MSLHPAVAAVRRGVRGALADLAPGDTVVVACSGGADSLALLSAAVFEGHKRGLGVIGATVDHGLQDGSAEHARHVVEQMAAVGVDETVSARVNVTGLGVGPEAAAREARYALLDELAQRYGARVVLLGHTRDDQAETVLLGLTRGSGGRSIAGMRRAFGVYRRPLLDVGRDDTVTACQVESLDYWSDPHNGNPAYTRVRVRMRVMPVLEEELGPGVAATLARTADQLRGDMEFLDDLAEEAYERLHGPDWDVAALAELPTALRRRVLRLAALAAGAPPGELFHEHVVALDALVTDWHGQRWVDLPGRIKGWRRDGRLHLGPRIGEQEAPG
jgi:tRNA(Ile)-lysidine synthase